MIDHSLVTGFTMFIRRSFDMTCFGISTYHRHEPPLATEGGAEPDADGGATVALSVAEKVAQEVAAAQDRGFGDAEETALKGLSYKERLRMLVDVDPPSGSSLPFSDESHKLLLYGKEVRCCCCVFWGWWLLLK